MSTMSRIATITDHTGPHQVEIGAVIMCQKSDLPAYGTWRPRPSSGPLPMWERTA